MNDKIAYIIYCIRKFGDRHGLNTRQSYAYLDRYKGLDFLYECYEAEHQLSFDDAVTDLTTICHRNGGGIE